VNTSFTVIGSHVENAEITNPSGEGKKKKRRRERKEHEEKGERKRARGGAVNYYIFTVRTEHGVLLNNGKKGKRKKEGGRKGIIKPVVQNRERNQFSTWKIAL